MKKVLDFFLTSCYINYADDDSDKFKCSKKKVNE
jgi:hypothetical protein